MWKDRVQKVYSSLEELRAYDQTYSIVRRCGFGSAAALWNKNPVIQGSTNPDDFGLAPGKHTTDHLAAIKSGIVTKTNVIGLRKIFNADVRRENGWGVGMTCPNYTHAEVMALKNALAKHKPRVTGDLHETGVKLLQSRRYRKRLESVAGIVAKLDTFRLVGYDRIGNHGEHAVPVYRAYAGRKSFLFRNIPWQSGGNGPEILPSNYTL